MLYPLLITALLLQSLPATPEFRRLDSGLRVAVVEDHALPLVSVQLWYRVGSAYDHVERPGLAHVARTLLEHRADAALSLRAAGVRFESRTWRDACCFASALPASPEFLEYVLKIEAERMKSRPVDQAQVNAALGAAARDFGLKPDDPAAISERLLLAGALPDHPYQHPPGLVAEVLKDLSPDEVNDFLARWFVPGNATLLIIGDVQPPQVFELVRRHFGDLPWAEPPRRAGLPQIPGERVELPAVAAARAGLDVAWVTPPAGAVENTTLDVLVQRLCNPVDGPLYRRLLDAGCVPPRWRHETWREAGLLVLSIDTRDQGIKGSRDQGSAGAASTDEDPLRAVVRMIPEEVARAAAATPPEIELNRARALAARELRTRWATFGGRALDLAAQEMIAGDMLRVELEASAIERTSVADLRAAARQLAEARTVVLPHTPRPPATQTSAPAPPRLLRPLAAQPAKPVDSDVALEVLAGRATDAPTPTTPSAAAQIATEILENGTRVTVGATRGVRPAVVRTIVHARPYLRDGLHAVLAVGSTRHSADQCRDYLSYHGLDMLPLGERGRCGLESHGPADRIAQMVELQAELLRSPDRSEAACKTAYDRLYALADMRTRTRVEARAEEVHLPPGMIGWREPGIFLPINAADVAFKLGQLAEIERVEVYVVGDVPPAVVFEAVRTAWSDWKSAVAGTQPADEAADQTASEAEALAGIARATGTPWTITQWTTDPLEPPLLVIRDMLKPDLTDRGLRKLVLLTAARCGGAPDESSMALGPRQTWRWRCALTRDDTLLRAADPSAGGVADAIEQALVRARRVPAGAVPHVADAVRLARVDRLVTLDSAAAIADLLEYGVAGPWDVQDRYSAGDIARLLADVCRVHMRVIAGAGPQDLSAELRRFEHPPTSSTQPSAP